MHKLERIDLNAHKEEIIDIIEDSLDHLKECDEHLCEKIKTKLYEMENGKKITEEKAIEWVKNMEPVGMHWTIDEITQAMQKIGYNCDKVDFFVVANMMYNDYLSIVKDNEELALKLAYDWLNDIDAKENKLYCYWKYIIKRD